MATESDEKLGAHVDEMRQDDKVVVKIQDGLHDLGIKTEEDLLAVVNNAEHPSHKGLKSLLEQELALHTVGSELLTEEQLRGIAFKLINDGMIGGDRSKASGLNHHNELSDQPPSEMALKPPYPVENADLIASLTPPSNLPNRGEPSTGRSTPA